MRKEASSKILWTNVGSVNFSAGFYEDVRMETPPGSPQNERLWERGVKFINYFIIELPVYDTCKCYVS